MVTLLKPDIVVSGNAERYLSNITADVDRIPFMLYPHAKQNCTVQFTPDLIVALNSIAEPESQRSIEFLASIGFKV